MKKLSFILPLFILTGILTATGCTTSGPTTAADRMRGHATDQQAEVNQQKQFAREWEEGRELVESGEEDVSEGTAKVREAEQNIREGRDLVAQGENKVERGQEKMRNAKQGFQRANPGVELNPGSSDEEGLI